MRRYGVPEPYEKLKAFTRGQRVTQESMQVCSRAGLVLLWRLSVVAHVCGCHYFDGGVLQPALWVTWVSCDTSNNGCPTNGVPAAVCA
jgi:hypothetical protein